jgi:hypothetical protein
MLSFRILRDGIPTPHGERARYQARAVAGILRPSRRASSGLIHHAVAGAFFSRLLHVRFGGILRGEGAEARHGGRIVDSTRDPATSLRFGSKFR